MDRPDAAGPACNQFLSAENASGELCKNLDPAVPLSTQGACTPCCQVQAPLDVQEQQQSGAASAQMRPTQLVLATTSRCSKSGARPLMLDLRQFHVVQMADLCQACCDTQK